MPPFPGNVKQLPSQAARKREWTARGTPSGTHRSFSAGKKLSSELRTRRHPYPGRAAPLRRRGRRWARSLPLLPLHLEANASAREVPTQWSEIGGRFLIWGGRRPAGMRGSTPSTRPARPCCFQSLRVRANSREAGCAEPALCVPRRGSAYVVHVHPAPHPHTPIYLFFQCSVCTGPDHTHVENRI